LIGNKSVMAALITSMQDCCVPHSLPFAVRLRKIQNTKGITIRKEEPTVLILKWYDCIQR
jgi:hypothetical protein